jgi:hypothetical protein
LPLPLLAGMVRPWGVEQIVNAELLRKALSAQQRATAAGYASKAAIYRQQRRDRARLYAGRGLRITRATVRKMMSGDCPATAQKPAWNAGPDSATVQKLAIKRTVAQYAAARERGVSKLGRGRVRKIGPLLTRRTQARCATRHKLGTQRCKDRASRQIATSFAPAA